MKIELGHLPDPDLNPNRTMHHIKKWKAKSIAKQEAYMLCLVSGQVPATPHERVLISITFISSDKKRRDLDNLFASMKAYIDGIVDAKVMKDDNIQHVSDYILRYRAGKKANTIIEIGGYDG